MNNPNSGFGLSRMRHTTVSDDVINESELRLERRLLRDEIRSELWRSGYRRPACCIEQGSNDYVDSEISSDEDEDCQVLES